MLGVSIPEAALANLKLYKYGSIDRSPITKYIMKPYWDWAVTLFPMWMAPNLITLVGFSFIFFNVFTAIYFSPNLEPSSYQWLGYTYALGLHLYQTFDNVDGRQARRTGSSSPLGELFDHGCDALNCCAAAMGTGNSWYTAAMPFLTMVPFYLSTWEEYHTGVLQLGFVNGPTEGILVATAILFFCGYWGPIWLLPLSESFPMLSGYLPAETTLAQVLLVSMALLVIFVQTPQSTLTVYWHAKEKRRSFSHASFGLIPLVVFFGAYFAWLAAPHSTVLRNHMIPFILATGVCFGRMASKIITAYVTKWTFPYFTVQMLPLLFGALNANLPHPVMPLEHEGTYLWCYVAFVFAAYLGWAKVTIDGCCRTLGIKAFSITKKSTN